MDTNIKLSQLGKSIYLLKPAINIDSIETITDPRYICSVKPSKHGLELSLPPEFSVPYLSINYLSVFGVGEKKDAELYVDIFLARRNYAFRIPMETIIYGQFFKPHYDIRENFRLFILNVLKNAQPIFIDESTASYLKDNILWIYDNFNDPYLYSRSIWVQIMFRKKVRCASCYEIMWEDIREKSIAKNCHTCREKNPKTDDPRILFAKYLSKNGFPGSELGDKLYKIVRLEKWLNGTPLHKVTMDQAMEFLTYLSKSGEKPDKIQSYRDLIMEYYKFCEDTGYETHKLSDHEKENTDKITSLVRKNQ